MDASAAPVLGATMGSTKQKRNRKQPRVNATFRLSPEMKTWLEQHAAETGTTATAVVMEELERLRALVRITKHVATSMQRNMARYQKQSDFMRAMNQKHVRYVTAWTDGGTLDSIVHRVAWDSLQQWMQHDPAERDAWLRFVVEGAEFWAPPEALTGDLFDERTTTEGVK